VTRGLPSFISLGATRMLGLVAAIHGRAFTCQATIPGRLSRIGFDSRFNAADYVTEEIS